MTLLVVFVLDAQRYGLDLAAVDRVLPMVAVSPLPKAPGIALGVVNVRGFVVPVLDIRRRFGRPPREYGLAAHLVVCRSRRRLLALPVDEVLGVREVDAGAVRPAETVLPGIEYVTGIVALPGGLLYIHDLESFLSLDEERGLAEALGEARE
ncbi:MAG: purine-binding chemotaxis protein CheW [Candidatus Rokubacteria bacterium]|nr:purine-binding chemotaxis protein CheW [Candidatus Rokubacteria bacterium]